MTTTRRNRNHLKSQFRQMETLEVRLNLSSVWGAQSHEPESGDDDHFEYEHEEHEGHDDEAEELEKHEVSAAEADESEEEEAAEHWNSAYDDADGFQNLDNSSTSSATLTLPSSESDSYAESDDEFEETPEFEALEALVEGAHEEGGSFALQDQHAAILDDVISHLADELLVPQEALHDLVVKPESVASASLVAEELLPASEPSQELSSVASSATESDAAQDETTPPAASEISLKSSEKDVKETSSSPRSSESVDGDSGMAQKSASKEADTGTVPAATSQNAVSIAPNAAVQPGNVTPEFETSDGEVSAVDVEVTSEAEGLDLTSANEATAELPAFGFGIRYGNTLEVLNHQIQLPFSDGVAIPSFPSRISGVVAGQNAGATLLSAAALAGGVLAAANAEKHPTVHKVIRRIRRTFRPVV